MSADVGDPARCKRPDAASAKTCFGRTVASYAIRSRRDEAMAISLEALQAEVLRLAPSDRARLLERLILSLDSDAETEAAWDAVAEARETEIATAAVSAVPLEEALARLEARFKA
jgi:hypothetical protein